MTNLPQDMLDAIKALPQSNKDDAVYRAIDNGDIDVVRALIRSGARTDYGSDSTRDVLAWGLRRTQELEMTRALLEEGLSARHVRYEDLIPFFSDFANNLLYTPLEEVWPVVHRMAQAGMPMEERAKVCAYALKKGYKANEILDLTMQAGEDVATVLDWALYDLRVTHEDVETAKTVDLASLRAVSEARYAPHYEAHFHSGITWEKLTDTVNDDGMTGFMLAVRAGHLKTVVDTLSQIYEERNGAHAFDTAEVTRKDAYGQSVLSLVGHRHELPVLFSPAIWKDHRAELVCLLDDLPPMIRPDVDINQLVEAACQAGVQSLLKQPPAPLVLQRKAKKPAL